MKVTHTAVQQSATIRSDAEGVWQAGPMQRGTYLVTLTSSAFGNLTIGRFEIDDGKTTDAGAFEIPTPGTLVVTMVDAAGTRLPDALARVRSCDDAENRGGDLQHREGVARGKLPAGRWLVTTSDRTALAAIEVEVRAGETTEARFVVPDAVPFVVKVPEPARSPAGLRLQWRHAGGSLLRDEMAEGDAELRLCAPPGHYTLAVIDQGRTVELTFDLRAADPAPVFDLPVPVAEPR